METLQTQQTENLIEQMLGFLDSTSDEEDNDELQELQQQQQQTLGDHDLENTNIPEVLCGSSSNNNMQEETKTNCLTTTPNKKSKNSIAKELNKIKNQFPIWNTKEIATSCKKLNDPIWRQTYSTAAGRSNENIDCDKDWSTKLESTCRRSNNSYVQEVNRVIYGDTTGHPPNGSSDYFQAAQNYAIYGKDFLDFPENLTPLLSDKGVGAGTTPDTSTLMGSSATAYGNGLYPTPTTPDITAPSTGVGFANFGKQSAATYYQMCNGMQPSTVRPASGSTAAAYGMFLGNKVTYVAAAPTTPPLVYNQHSSTTTNFISNSLANAALATSPAILYSNPMLTTTTQQYLNTSFFKETQYLSGGTAQGSTGIYERLVYAQMLQQQIYHQTQQQAAAVAAMFQHKQRTASTRAAANGAAIPNNTNTLSGLNLCGRPVALSAASASSELLVNTSKPSTVVTPTAVAIPANGVEDNLAPLID